MVKKMKKVRYLFIILLISSCQSSVNSSSKALERPEFSTENQQGWEILFISPNIKKGGSGVILLKKLSNHISNFSLLVDNSHPIKFVRFGGTDKFIAFFGWPVYSKNFNLQIVYDLSNTSITNTIEMKKIPIEYKKIQIKLSSQFTLKSGKELNIKKLPKDPLKGYSYVINKFKEKTVFDTIMFTKNATHESKKFNFFPFNPFEKYNISSPFGTERTFIIGEKAVRTSYHFGIDYTWEKNFEIKAIAEGKVVFAGYNGLSGNYILIDHGLGIYSGYAHCSKIFVKKDDIVKKGDLIALSGSSGYATGDHLHFSLIINGICVNPLEWFDEKWRNENIYPILKYETPEISKAD